MTRKQQQKKKKKRQKKRRTQIAQIPGLHRLGEKGCGRESQNARSGRSEL